VYTDTYTVPAGSGPCSIGSGTHRQTRPCSTPACAAAQQLTPIQRFTMDWGKQALSGSAAISTTASSAPDCAQSCVNTPGCTAFVMDWSNSDGSLGDVVGGCTLYSTLTPKVSSRARAVYSKI
jgi:hypothetical protein